MNQSLVHRSPTECVCVCDSVRAHVVEFDEVEQ